MIGHEKIIGDLQSFHERGSLGHGYIFFGPAMVGKRMAAMECARFLEHGSLEQSDAHEAMLTDLMLVAPSENGSIGIDAVREIRNFLWQKPNASPRRTLIIDDAELLTTEAQNALLKLTEEPPISSLLILVTSDVESILSTITSRLPKIYFGAVPEKEIVKWLEMGGEKKKAAEIAKKATGKPGLAWRLLHDEDFKGQIELAEKLLKTPAATRRDLIKKIIEPDEFRFRKFLDAFIITLAWQGVTGSKAALWHKALALYDRETNFSLNPRLQLEALLMA
jgi:DNA polymerase III subunit delta'